MKRNITVHPDALYDSIYDVREIETDDYERMSLEYKGEYRDEKGVTVLTMGGECVIVQSCLENCLRLRITKAGRGVLPSVTERLGLIETQLENTGYSSEFKDNCLHFSNKEMSLTYDFGTNEYEFTGNDGKLLIKTKNGGARFSEGAEYSGMKSLTDFERIGDERFFGFGARMYHIDRTGESADIFSEKGGAKVGDYGGFPVPYFISTNGYGVFFNNPWPHVYFDMAKSDENAWFINSPGGDYDIFVFKGDTPAEIIKSYTAVTGRNQMPQRWLMGYWCSSIRFDEAENAVSDMTRMRNEGYPCDAIVIDGPWRGGKNFIRDYNSGWGYPSDDYNWHKDFGDGVGMIKKLKKQNIKTVLHINSCAFKSETAIPAIARGLLRQVKSETVPDVATERGLEFYKGFLEPRIKEGVSLWWTDHSDRVSGEVLPGIPSRNLFGVLWNKAITGIMAENGIKNSMSLSRGGGIGSQRYALPWAGDTEFGIHRFKEDIWYIINAGMAGFTLCGYDIGGFMRANKKSGDADAEQFDIDNVCRRICQSMIFCPMPRMHNGDSAKPKWPWNCPEKTRELYKDCLKFRYRLIPTIYSYAINGAKTGEPIIRPMYYKNLKDKRLYGFDTQFYMGEDIIIAPVTEKGTDRKEVYLPEGEWFSLWTKEQFDGEQTVLCGAPLLKKEGLPIFVRSGGGIVFGEDCMSLSEEIPPKLRVELYVGNSSNIVLNESETVSNRFGCTVYENSISIYAENNSNIDREYEIVIYGCGEKKKIIAHTESKSVFERRIGL